MSFSEILSSSSTRIKTGLALIIAAVIIGYIDSFFYYVASFWRFTCCCN